MRVFLGVVLLACLFVTNQTTAVIAAPVERDVPTPINAFIFENILETFFRKFAQRREFERFCCVCYKGYRFQPQSETPCDAYTRLHNKAADYRTIVTRLADAKTPTWDGKQPAFIVSPFLWRYDPYSAVQKLHVWPSKTYDDLTVIQYSSGSRRSIVGALLESDVFYASSPQPGWSVIVR
jgi:hypothetical protein